MQSRWVLVVEDDHDTREMLREVLELEGYRIVEAEDGTQALDRLAGQARFALMVLDLRLPRLDGLGVLTAMAADPGLRRVPVVAISASLPRGPLPVAAFFHKPFALEEFLDRLAERTALRAPAGGPRPPRPGQGQGPGPGTRSRPA